MELARSLGLRLSDKAGRSVPASELDGKVVALYFSAHWCPPCKGFTPALKKFYEEIQGQGGAFEIIFVSSDRSAQEGQDYFNNDHGNWLMLDVSQKDAVSGNFEIKGIPTLIVIDPTGKAVVPDARSQVGSGSSATVFAEWKKLACVVDWRETGGTSLGGAPVAGSPEAMRAARLARLGGGPPVAAPTPEVSSVPPAAAPPAAAPLPPLEPLSAYAPAAAPPSGAAPTQAADSEALTQLTAMGFAPEQARNALDASGGNIEVAVGMLQGETADPTATLAQAPADDSEAVAQLTSMGFAADQARHALEATGGDVQNAAALLLDS